MNERVKQRYEKLKKDSIGYKLNPDEKFVAMLAEGMLSNQDRYGLETCPCRLYEGEKEDNLDIVCPCIYRDDDLAEYGACFCALYVTDGNPAAPVPERRPSLSERQALKKEKEERKLETPVLTALPYPVYRCEVCGYLSANNHPPHICPICKAGKERFERFM
ncbi:MAG: ferredoxin-thioredoxin reductase catalytic domain-containing protein [Clostridia bacterium]